MVIIMLDKNGTRQLAYVVVVDTVTPIEGYDRVELAHVGGWTVVVGKNEFHAGDPAIYFEIDSKLPEVKPFINMEFLAKKGYKVKTQKMCKSISQGLLMSAANFENQGWWKNELNHIIDSNGNVHKADDESRFLTKQLGVTYYVAEDNTRKANSVDKYKRMAQRNGKLFSHQPFRWLMKRDWGKKFLFVFFGRKRDKKNEWPSHICSKTDVERIQNMIWVLNDKTPYVATEKVDGSSFTVTAERTRFGKIKYKVCSRNVVFKDENQKCFYDSNIYFEMYHKYNLKEKITKILNDLNLQNVAIQAEIYGTGIQKRDYSLNNEHRIAIFHIVSNNIKYPMDKVVEICTKYDLPHVPIINYNYILPNTLDELQEFTEKYSSILDNKEKEGIVFYDVTGQKYFKFVSPNFLMKYH